MRSLLLGTLAMLLAPLGALAQSESGPVRRIGLGSCIHQEKPQPIWDAIHAAKPEVFLLLGDNIYGDSSDMEVIRKKYQKAKEVPGYAKLFRDCKIQATWDDHDYGRNDAGVEFEGKKGAQQLFCDFLDLPANDPLRKQEGIYNAKMYGPEGKRVQVILLDGRYHRSPIQKGGPENGYLPNTDPDATFLGEAQWKWLEEQLKQPAEVRLIGSGIQVLSEDHPYEKWATIPAERKRLFQLIKDTQAKGVILLSGDRHLAELSVSSDAVGYPLYDLTASGLNQASKTWRAPEKNRYRVGGMPYGDHFGMIDIDWSVADPIIRLQIRDDQGEVTVQQKISLSTLQPRSTARAPRTPTETLPGVLTPAEAFEKRNVRATVEMKVQSTGKGGPFFYLNSERSFRTKTNFTVAIALDDLPEGKDTVTGEKYLNKTIRATGMITQSNNGPRLIIRDLNDLKVNP
ncbi:alkaline phosphatase D family protein [Tuwongella immobilis]|uniref:PhoD-like phosphatase metallophosphatase domain-containing protein n=1 Tax=Tuwongella immobilis TaxID=692036 RepID=A0A6C2YUG7_9BACT|nr:alkaline phosphatase D family protein [Tuwongella immobilis]VIP05031.1 Phosphodiesterase/alkaline phosphatase D OS=uncultured planctomycete GN=HGMM_F11F07C03 PE=4 SV=1: PhoD [Tuwongella immobilis]VTS07418.1 Phosphodiesterase/alkaline phosphatase D OS=uncultured planctomycete GN=HGMM_F11F07C03 PE=4 SV=1: PhoD [Tuwongella immobilis]